MDLEPAPQARWPAYATAVLFLGYAVGKAVFAAQGRLGLPGGPVVPAEEHERYAREVMDVAVVQWLAVGTGLLGAVLVIATVTGLGRRVPRTLMLLALGSAMVAVGAGVAIVVADALLGLGVGWQPHHAAVGVVAVALLVATIRSYARATGQRTATRHST